MHSRSVELTNDDCYLSNEGNLEKTFVLYFKVNYTEVSLPVLIIRINFWKWQFQEFNANDPININMLLDIALLNQWTFKFVDQVKLENGIPLTLMKQYAVKHGYSKVPGIRELKRLSY